MPSITVNLPETKGDQLQKSLLKEFDRLRKQLQGMKDSDHSDEMMKSLLKQQDNLVKAMERMMQRFAKMPSASEGMGAEMKSLHQSLSGLKEAILKNSSRSRNRTFGSNY